MSSIQTHTVPQTICIISSNCDTVTTVKIPSFFCHFLGCTLAADFITVQNKKPCEQLSIPHLSWETFEGHFNVRSASVWSVSQESFYKLNLGFTLFLKAVCVSVWCPNWLSGRIEWYHIQDELVPQRLLKKLRNFTLDISSYCNWELYFFSSSLSQWLNWAEMFHCRQSMSHVSLRCISSPLKRLQPVVKPHFFPQKQVSRLFSMFF